MNKWILTFSGALALTLMSNTQAPEKKVQAKRYHRIELGAIPGTLAPVVSDAMGPIEVTWKMLADVTYKDMYVKELDAYYWKPTFGASVQSLSGKEIFITGYLIPVDYDAGFYVVSKFPYANCFFCGGGGPESVVDLRFAGKHRNYKTDERLTFKGRLKLNADDVYQMNYILEGAVEYGPK